jgi:trans-AT polyketide synthase, acyltransferase and oxidoreductase domains
LSAPARPDGTDACAPVFSPEAITAGTRRIREHVHIVTDSTRRALGLDFGPRPADEVVGTLPPLYPEWLGGRTFCETHGVRFPYVAGEMANGIATTRMVTEMAHADMLGFFGAAGLGLPEVERAVSELADRLRGRTNWGVNLIHSPAEPELELRAAKLLLHHRVPCVSLSAYLDLTPTAVLCATRGLRRHDGRIVRPTRVLAKVSRPEVAEKFLSPAPPELLRRLVEQNELSAEEAELARCVPVAEDITVEADSGGHTDRRPLGSLLPRVLMLRDDVTRRFGYRRPVGVGAGGGLGTPAAVAAAFALGAAYVVTGSVNQSAVEAGISDDAKALLAQADVADVAMAPAADMFEMGVTLQVLRRGTMFAPRAARLYAVYRAHPSLEDIPAPVRAKLEREVLGTSVAEVWERTKRFWTARDPEQITRAERDPKHRMALVFRWYLGSSSRWAIEGDTGRRADYQIWCGPAMGAFNRWAAGGFLAERQNRTVVQIALNLLEGAAVLTRAHQLRTYGVPVPDPAFVYTPRRLA